MCFNYVSKIFREVCAARAPARRRRARGASIRVRARTLGTPRVAARMFHKKMKKLEAGLKTGSYLFRTRYGAFAGVGGVRQEILPLSQGRFEPRQGTSKYFKDFLKKRTFLALGRGLPREFSREYNHYVFKHIFVKQIRSRLVNELVRGRLEHGQFSSLRTAMGGILKRFDVRRHKYLFKDNPDAEGRSRVFYYLQKKT